MSDADFLVVMGISFPGIASLRVQPTPQPAPFLTSIKDRSIRERSSEAGDRCARGRPRRSPAIARRRGQTAQRAQQGPALLHRLARDAPRAARRARIAVAPMPRTKAGGGSLRPSPACTRRGRRLAPARGWNGPRAPRSRRPASKDGCAGASRQRVDEQREPAPLEVERILHLELVFLEEFELARPALRVEPIARRRSSRSSAPTASSPRLRLPTAKMTTGALTGPRRSAVPSPWRASRSSSTPSAPTSVTSSAICPSACVAHDRHGSKARIATSMWFSSPSVRRWPLR